MAVGTPIKLGSAAEPRLVFQEGSTITISDSGIQECSIKALCPDGKNVFNYLPLAGTTYDDVFGNDYLPADFKVDRSKDSSIQIEYNRGTTATVTLSFKRPDPDKTGVESRKISVDSAFVFKSLDAVIFGLDTNLDGAKSMGATGFPEPVVTVKYNNPAIPDIGGTLYALPGTPKALGFPTVRDITLTFTLVQYTDVPAQSGNIYELQVVFGPSPLGWQQTGVSAEPIADKSFFDVSETWRTFYIFKGCNVSKTTPFISGVQTAVVKF